MNENIGFSEVKKEIISKLSYRNRNVFPTDLKYQLERKGFVKVCLGCGEKLTGRKESWCGGNCANEHYNKYFWSNIREKLIRKYNKCQACSSGSFLEVHHIHPIALGGDPFEEENLIVLCPDCHLDAHSGLGASIKDYRDKLYYENYVKTNHIRSLDKFGLFG